MYIKELFEGVSYNTNIRWWSKVATVEIINTCHIVGEARVIREFEYVNQLLKFTISAKWSIKIIWSYQLIPRKFSISQHSFIFLKNILNKIVILRSRITRSYEKLVLTFLVKSPHCFSQGLSQTIFSLAVYKSSFSTTSLPTHL